MFPTISIQSLNISACQLRDLETLFLKVIRAKQHIKLATVNLNFLRLANTSSKFNSILNDMDYCLPDGWPILALAKKRAFPERVTGSDLTQKLLKWAPRHHWRLGIVGGSRDVKEKLKKTCQEVDSEIEIEHWTPNYPSLSKLKDPDLSKKIRLAAPDILLVALGAPKQEYWIAENFSDTNAFVAIGVGASIDFIVGKKKRAPEFWQKHNMEFVYRFLHEPKRLGKRYLKDFLFYLSLKLQP